MVSALTVVALISIASSTYLILYADPIYRVFQKSLTIFEKTKTHKEPIQRGANYELVLFGYKRGGQEFVKLFEGLKKKFVVVDYDPETIEGMERHDINCIYGDATDIELLEEIGIDKAKLIVSTISDHDSNVFLLRLIMKINSKAIVIVHAETLDKSQELYELGASYVVVPHYIGNENVAKFIKNSSLKKSEFTKHQDEHLDYIKKHYAIDTKG